MISRIQRNIITRALKIRMSQGENPEEILAGYRNLTDSDKTEILEAVAFQGKE